MTKQHPTHCLLLAREDFHIQIDGVVHGQNRRFFLPCTACGIRWELKATELFPLGLFTEEKVNCMTCLVKMASL